MLHACRYGYILEAFLLVGLDLELLSVWWGKQTCEQIRNKMGDNNYCTRKVLRETQGGKSITLTGDSSRG